MTSEQEITLNWYRHDSHRFETLMIEARGELRREFKGSKNGLSIGDCLELLEALWDEKKESNYEMSGLRRSDENILPWSIKSTPDSLESM